MPRHPSGKREGGGEERWLRWVCRAGAASGRRVRVGPGDDAAVIRSRRGGDLVVTTDVLVEGVHFDLATASPGEVGRKAIACNLSDIAAMGCHPVAATVTVAAPAHVPLPLLRRIHRGMRSLADRFGVALVGGDYSRAPEHLVLGVALYGETRGLRPLRRCDARLGDAILVTGRLGGSILGRHHRFTPRVEEGIRLNRRYTIHAMIDLSDGLSTDLWRILRASGVGAVLDEERIPVARAARRLASRSGRSPLEHALDDGEDFELLFTARPQEGKRIRRDPKLGRLVTRIGAVVPAGCTLRGADGRERPLHPGGYEHGLPAD